MPGPELPPRAGGLGALCRPRGAGGRAAAAAARARPAGHPASRPAGAALALSLRLHLRQLRRPAVPAARRNLLRSEEHTSELQSLMRISYAVFCLKKKQTKTKHNNTITTNK